MLDIRLTVQWHDSIGEWRVSGSGGDYYTAKTIEKIPEAVRGIMLMESKRLAQGVQQ